VIADRREPQTLLHDLGMDIRCQHVAGVDVPQLVHASRPFLQKGRNDVNKVAGLQWGPIRLGDDVQTVIGTIPSLNNSSAWATRQRRNSSTASEGGVSSNIRARSISSFERAI
jgi:hypothetical protein